MNDQVAAPWLLTVGEAASVLRISRSRMYELVMAGRVASVKIGRCRRVEVTALRAFISEVRDA